MIEIHPESLSWNIYREPSSAPSPESPWWWEVTHRPLYGEVEIEIVAPDFVPVGAALSCLETWPVRVWLPGGAEIALEADVVTTYHSSDGRMTLLMSGAPRVLNRDRARRGSGFIGDVLEQMQTARRRAPMITDL